MAGGTHMGDTVTDPDVPVTGDVIELAVPALASFLSVVRTATAGLAARLSFTFDEIEDLRIAVDEACVMALALPRPSHAEVAATLTCRFRVLTDALVVTVCAPVDESATLPAPQSIAWQMLAAHAPDVRGAIINGEVRLELRKARGDSGRR